MFYQIQMRLFRGQRNFYISGFGLFSVFIIKRLIALRLEQAKFEEEIEYSHIHIDKLSKRVRHLLEEIKSLNPDYHDEEP